MPARVASNPSPDAMDTSDGPADDDASRNPPPPAPPIPPPPPPPPAPPPPPPPAHTSSAPADTSRRRSTRVVKKPELLSTQQAAETPKAKRKRPAREESESESGDDDDDDNDDDDDDEDQEEDDDGREGKQDARGDRNGNDEDRGGDPGETTAAVVGGPKPKSKSKPKPKPKPKPKAKPKESEKEGPADEAEDENDDDDEDDESGSSGSSHSGSGSSSEDDDDDDDDESEGEPDEEEIKERRRKNAAARARRGAAKPATKKPPAKKTRTATGAVPAPVARKTANGRKKSAAKGKAKAVNGEGEEDADADATEGTTNYLYNSVFEGEEDHDDIAQQWTQKYEEDNSEAMKDMVNFILKCCGCDKYVTSYDIEDQDSAATTLSQIQEAFQLQKTADYPLTSKKPTFRRFRHTLSTFLHALITTVAAHTLLASDPALIENIQVWITAMSSSTLRQFRHTSTVVALDIVSSLSSIAAEQRKANSTTNRQLEAEGKKAKRNEGRITALEEKLKEGDAHRDTAENIIRDIFDTVFVHRYRDIDARIRSDCVRELGAWILVLPDVFFDGSYLRYLGWVLSDTTPATRLEVVKALTKLYRKKDSVGGLRHFTERFRPRLVEMATRDADSSVRAATVELLDVVREVGYLEPEDVDTVGRLLFDSEPKVRKAVVGFFVENISDLYEAKLEELGGEETVTEALDGDDGGPTMGWIKLKCLVEVLATYDLADGAEAEDEAVSGEKSVLKGGDAESRFSLAGGVLWDAFEELADWEGVARYLLFDHSAHAQEPDEEEDVQRKVKGMVALGAREEAILLQVLNASVAASITEGGEGGKKKGAAKRTVKEIEKHTETVSRNLMMLIPPLLKKFGPVPDAASSVLRLEQLMKLDVFQELRQSTAYASLLDDINRQFLTHADESVLKEASAALLHAKTFEELDEVTDQKVGQLKDETVTALVNAVRGKDLAKGKFSDASLTELINTVRRLEYIASITNCVEIMETPSSAAAKAPAVRPVEVLMNLLLRGASVDELEEELMIRTMKTLEYYFMWKISTIAELEDIAELDIDELVARRDAAMGRIGGILQTRSKVDPVRVTAAATLMGLATLFIATAARSAVGDTEVATKLGALGRALEPPLQELLLTVFDAVEKTFAKAARKTLEPDEHAAPQDEEPEEEEDDDGEAKTEADESAVLVHEQRLCEITGKIVLGVLSRAVDEKLFRKRLARNVGVLGPNYREIVAHLDAASDDAPKKVPGKRGRKPRPYADEVVIGSDGEEEHEDPEPQTRKPADGKRPSGEEEEEEDEQEEDEQEEDEDEQHDENAELEEEDEKRREVESDNESEPDPEAEVPPDGGGDEDEDMPDV